MKSRSTIRVSLTFVLALALAVPFLTFTRNASAQLTGAIYTSTGDGETVNGNVYKDCCDVFLNGGPPPNAPCTSGGLPDGDYYFQVTDPSGQTKLSTDDISRRKVRVSGGVITEYLGGESADCDHEIGKGKCPNAISVQLMPFSETPNAGGEYKVWITPVDAYDTTETTGTFGFQSSSSKTDNFKCRMHEPCPEPPCVEPPRTAIGGVKYYDLNTDGVFTPGEVTIPGWRIDVSYTLPDNTTGTITTFTDLSGTWALVFPAGTTYTACEVIPPNTTYIQTGPNAGATTSDNNATANASKCWGGTVGTVDTADLNFGNVCLGAGGGLTLGFWSNKNGEAAIKNCSGGTSGTLTFLSGLCLRNATGNDFDPTSYSGFRSWLLNATATNMSYMLSAQLAAMELNVRCGSVNGTALVFAGANPAGCSVPVNGNGFISVNALMSDANAELCADGFTPAGDPNRTCQEFKKNALDKANNNLNFVQASPCPFTTPY
ncbi:MAG TPA: hypothetical protein VNN73_10265 [Blastocatellia bacterium]|nr:hypothetical protein [Blastocatellia bacterium]